jgi:hypothetical protein
MRAFLLLCLAFAAPSSATPPAFVDGWIREAPPTAGVLAGYGRIAYTGTTPIVLTGARSAAFDKVELHEMRMDQGVMRMRALQRIEVAKGGFEFAPGGTHLMLIGPHKKLHAGDTVEIVFDIDGAPAAIRSTLTVR